MAAKKKTTKQAKVKKKIWVPIVAPSLFNGQSLGETLVVEKKDVLGKRMRVNLMQLTNDPKKQGIEVTFVCDSQQGDAVGTSIVAYRVLPSSVKRSIRRRRTRIDDSFLAQTADGKTVRLKPFLLSRAYVHGSVERELRIKSKLFLLRTVKKTSYKDLVREVVLNKLQHSMKSTLSKVYPLSQAYLRSLELVTGKKALKTTAEKVVEEPAKPAKQEA